MNQIAYPLLALLLAFLNAIGPFSIDAYLPAFPAMQASLATDAVAMQQSLTAYMIPFSVMMLWHGAISDALGRRHVIIAGLVVYVAASLLCAFAPNIHMLLIGRMLQGLSAGSGVIVGRAVVRDLLDGPAAQRMMSHVAMVFAIAPAVAPILGGAMTEWFGWRSIFFFLVLLASAQIFMTWRFLPESLPPEKRQPLHAGDMLRGYLAVLGSGRFVLLGLSMSFVFLGFFLYVMSAPVFLMQHLKLDATQFGYLFVPLVVGMIGGSVTAVRLSRRITPLATIRLAFVVSAVAALWNLAANLWLPDSVATRIPQLALQTFAMNLSFPSLTLLALDMFPERRGMAASCQGFIHTLIMSAVAGVLAPLLWDSLLQMALAMCVMWVLSIGFFYWSRQISRPAAPAHKQM
ncbi:MAG: Bcr/CflA family drug resistance efflux transporter [Candidatus Dactylopiibacterium carminicum]|uniref:Bcr/CflA family efflux transporter n=1 Tax=Candidatus Dactylopiibacterium carminicum TaxID=857335 RepID=A0A272EWJ6_9RHOO|nr:multidrug effflux MFS transporter [Candidatus Dactylopiibacterium carminicum]KAF7599936.1 Bcr/CflA family drug resistance efflux transporter [Candidatus Dactylopiibacterium carminicum]PAS94484.1 MAG: Bcr/CflA family drug resistance efflux transporter [Candidatus Dactylopiibacterium carminicum]PAS97032.1 MAG: Bcr/CflA family drug resistance efflux transporter [Candidatus Dactylopiibacterium carminicum]PAS99939.1 MAG: Bcr/CflA family drug resistance efflux transporter [Candidatus Dactylopiibac